MKKETTPQGTTVMKVTSLVVSWPKKYLDRLPSRLADLTPGDAQMWLREASERHRHTEPEFSWNLWWVAGQLEGVGSFRFLDLSPVCPRCKVKDDVDHVHCVKCGRRNDGVSRGDLCDARSGETHQWGTI